MAKSQQEINYENALKDKNDAQFNLNEANKKVVLQDGVILQAQADYDAYGKYDCDGSLLYYETTTQLNALKQLAGILGCAKVYSTVQVSSATIEGNRLLDRITTEKNNLISLKAGVITAKSAYDVATANVANAYNDWLEWKKANMSASELEEFLELENKEAGGRLRMDVWKWLAIGVGVLLFGWGAWKLVKKFGKPKIA